MLTNTNNPTTLLDCGHSPTPTNGIGTGVAYGDDGEGNSYSMCYDCARIDLMDSIKVVGLCGSDLRVPIVYMDAEWKNFTTWDGQIIGHITKVGKRHVFSKGVGGRRHIEGVFIGGADVVNVYGVGAPGMYCLLFRRKSDLHVKQG